MSPIRTTNIAISKQVSEYINNWYINIKLSQACAAAVQCHWEHEWWYLDAKLRVDVPDPNDPDITGRVHQRRRLIPVNDQTRTLGDRQHVSESLPRCHQLRRRRHNTSVRHTVTPHFHITIVYNTSHQPTPLSATEHCRQMCCKGDWKGPLVRGCGLVWLYWNQGFSSFSRTLCCYSDLTVSRISLFSSITVGMFTTRYFCNMSK